MLWKLLSSVVLINFVIVSYVEGNGDIYFPKFFFVKLISRKKSNLCEIDFTKNPT